MNDTNHTIEEHRTETYTELMQKARALVAEAERVRKKDRQEVILDIIDKMRAYDIEPHELKRRRVKRTQNVVYRDPNTGKTWGGIGRMPSWLRMAVAGGVSLESFRVAAECATA